MFSKKMTHGNSFRSAFLVFGTVANFALSAGAAAAAAPAAQSPWADPTAAGDANQITMALSYVTYVDANNKPVVSQDLAKKDVARINEIYKQCDIHFRVEQYQAVNPKDRGLDFGLGSMSDLDKIRSQFDEPNRLVVINTGNWDHGSLGPANAWTAMPGANPSGAVIEGAVSDDGGIVAHELGHYLSLDHVSDTSDLMNPIIYPTSTTLTSDQCQAVRKSAATDRAASRR